MNERDALIEKLKENCEEDYIDDHMYTNWEKVADFILEDRKRTIDKSMTSALNMVPYLLFDTSPKGIEVYSKSLRQSIEQRVSQINYENKSHP